MNDLGLTILIAIDITGAIIYSAINPFSMSIWEEDLYNEDSDRSNKRTVLNFLLAIIFHACFVFTWIAGIITTYQLMKKGKYFNILKSDIRYLSKVIDAYLLSEVEKMDDDQINAEIDCLETLFNRYRVLVHYLDRDNPYDIHYNQQAREIFKRRTRLKRKAS